MNYAPLYTLIQNAALLLALVVVGDLITRKKPIYATLLRQVLAGIIVGGLCIGLMLTAFHFKAGIIFDTRSVLLSISGLFFGIIPTLLAMAIAATYRLLIGGGGVVTGIFAIFTTGMVGIIWRHCRRGQLHDISAGELYGFGVVTHILVLVIMLTLPRDAIWPTLTTIGLPILLIYPIATVALGALLANRFQREYATTALSESEQRFRRLFTLAPMPLALSDKDGKLTLVNERWERTLGYTLTDIPTIDKWWQRAYPDPDYRRQMKDTWDASLRHAKETNRQFVGPQDCYVTCKKNDVRMLEITATFLGEDLLVAFFDITERKSAEDVRHHLLEKVERDRKALLSMLEDKRRTENELRERNAFITTVLDNIPLGLAVNSIDPTVDFTYMNDNFSRIYRVPKKTLTMSDAFWVSVYEDPAFREELKKRVMVDCASGDPERMQWNDIPLKRHGEETTYISARNVPIPDKSLMISLVWDITARKKAEDKIHTLNEELEQRVIERTAQLAETNKELEAFSYSVSHDLRAPLRHISGYVDLLNTRFQDNLSEKATHYLHQITDSAQQMGALIDDLLRFSRIGRQELHRDDVAMNVLVDQVIEQLKVDIKDRHISWSVGELPCVHGDTAMLRQVWMNLLENAVKYTRNTAVAHIEIGCTRTSRDGEFYVRDNGVGFDMQYAGKLFGVFQRLHSQHEYKGTGIGLASVQRIIHKHGGRVRAEAQPDEGATIYFTLPVTKEK